MLQTKIISAIQEYQCSGCGSGCGVMNDIECFKTNVKGIGCGKHSAGTIGFGTGSFFLGMPKGFNRLGGFTRLKPIIFDTFESSDWEYDKFNIPVWKYLSKDGHTFVKGFMPRRSEPFVHVFLENCIDKVNCLEITQNDIDNMD
jgi:hypothetical protein